jgi:hypothetical protein
MSRLTLPVLFVTMGLFSVCFTVPDKLWCLPLGRHALAQSDPSQASKMSLTSQLKFDPDRVAAAEVRMWKAYYGGKIQEVGLELLDLLVGQFHLSAPDALVIAVDLSSATLAFQSAREDYQTQVLPGLRGAYGRLKTLTKGAWDAEAAAQAELEWWVKRRTPGHNSPEEVGRSIAKLYKILYGKSNRDIERAGLLRAQAAHIRDTGSDWSKIRKLLQESYRLLSRGIQ